MVKIKKAHLKDVDFRKREVRQSNAVNEIKQWYNESVRREDYRQARAFSAVLWLLMPKQDYRQWQLQDDIKDEQQAIATLDEEALELLKQFI